MNAHKLEGKRFGKLMVIAESGERRRGQIVWSCQCDCGNIHSVPSYYLTANLIVSCGCHGRSILGKATKTHGKCRTREYEAWNHMWQRCLNPKTERFLHYGGRGIKVCNRWRSFENFFADMGLRPSATHSVGRLDNDGNYSPRNCAWQTREEQANNKSNCVFLKVGRTSRTSRTIAQWARIRNICESTIYRRLKKGMAHSEAVA